MKQKSLLILASMMMLTLSASAQWTKPAMSTFTDMATDGQTVQFLYNVGTQRFLVGANEWSTRASVGEQGDSVRIVDLEDGFYAINAIAVVNAGKTSWGYISCASYDAMWMDRSLHESGYPGTDQWMITKTGDTYKIRNNYINDEDAFTWGVAEIFKGAADNRLYIYDPTVTYTKTVDGEEFAGQPAFEGAFYDEWKFVSKNDYLDYSSKMEAYLAAESLKAALDKAEEENPGIDLAAQKAVYNNTNSTTEELKTAEAEIAAVIVEYLKGKEASVDNPVNYTSSIVNPTFDIIGDFTGWEGSGFRAGGTTSTCAEWWRSSFDTYQDIEGLPDGVYMLQVNAYCRTKDDLATDYQAWVAGTPANARMYLSSESAGLTYNTIKHISEGLSPTQLDTADQTVTTGEGETRYAPDTMQGANTYFHDGREKYWNYVYGALGEDETLRIGVSNSVSSDWNLFDDFQLFYLGKDITAYQLLGSNVAEKSTVDLTAPYGGPEKKVYDDIMAKLSSSNTKDDILDAVKQVAEAVDAIYASKQSYAAYIEKCQWAEQQLNDMEEQGYSADVTAALADYLQASAFDNDDVTAEHNYPNGCMNYIIDLENEAVEGRLSAAAIDEETEWLQNLVQQTIQRGIDEGVDVTTLLVNPSFKDGFSGWTNAVGNTGGLASFPVVECYGTIVDCYQTVKMKPGVYEISVRAFERPAANGSYTGNEASVAYIYLNDYMVPVQNICKDPMPEDKAEDNVNCYLTNDYNVEGLGYVPNSVTGASYAFQADRYKQTFYGIVGEDSVMRIGLTSNNNVVHWVLWADFHVTYMAKNPEILSGMISDYVELSETVTDAGQPDMDRLENAVETARSASDGDAMYDAVAELAAAYKNAVNSADAYKTADALFTNLENALSEFDATAGDEAKEAAKKVREDYKDNIDNRIYAGSEVDGINEKIKLAIAALKVPDLSNPPVDITSVIQNPDLEVGNADPWIITVGAANKGYQNNNVYTNAETGTELNQFIETWRSGAILDDGYIYQVLQALPAGQYKLECDAIASWQSNASTVVTGVELIMAEAASDEEVTDYSGTTLFTANGKPEHFEVTFTKTSDSDTPLLIGIRVNGTNANWVAADNFKLTYLGAGMRGDVNEDGKVDINDVVAIINVMAGTATWPNANVNGDTDGNIDINDVVSVINIMAGN